MESFIDLPLIVCVICGLFYGIMWIVNKDLIWQTPQHHYYSWEEWFAANNPKGLWYAPLIIALVWPHYFERISLDPISDFLIIRLFATALAVAIGYGLSLKLFRGFK